jgi:hypothetical protein
MAFNVLIVDDSSVTRKILERSLRQAKFPIGEVLERQRRPPDLF